MREEAQLRERQANEREQLERRQQDQVLQALQQQEEAEKRQEAEKKQIELEKKHIEEAQAAEEQQLSAMKAAQDAKEEAEQQKKTINLEAQATAAQEETDQQTAKVRAAKEEAEQRQQSVVMAEKQARRLREVQEILGSVSSPAKIEYEEGQTKLSDIELLKQQAEELRRTKVLKEEEEARKQREAALASTSSSTCASDTERNDIPADKESDVSAEQKRAQMVREAEQEEQARKAQRALQEEAKRSEAAKEEEKQRLIALRQKIHAAEVEAAGVAEEVAVREQKSLQEATTQAREAEATTQAREAELSVLELELEEKQSAERMVLRQRQKDDILERLRAEVPTPRETDAAEKSPNLEVKPESKEVSQGAAEARATVPVLSDYEIVLAQQEADKQQASARRMKEAILTARSEISNRDLVSEAVEEAAKRNQVESAKLEEEAAKLGLLGGELKHIRSTAETREIKAAETASRSYLSE